MDTSSPTTPHLLNAPSLYAVIPHLQLKTYSSNLVYSRSLSIIHETSDWHDYPRHPAPIQSPLSKTLNLEHNRIKDLGVEVMSCATLGQEYKEQRKRQSQTRRRQYPQSCPQVTPLASTHDTKKENGHRSERDRFLSERDGYQSNQNGYQSKRIRTEHLCQSEVGSNLTVAASGHLPPLAGTPLYVAAAASCSGTRREKPRARETSPKTTTCVLLDGNRVSMGAVAGQGALAGIGETALFRGCVLPETIVRNKEWTRGAFWNKGGRVGRDG